MYVLHLSAYFYIHKNINIYIYIYTNISIYLEYLFICIHMYIILYV